MIHINLLEPKLTATELVVTFGDGERLSHWYLCSTDTRLATPLLVLARLQEKHGD